MAYAIPLAASAEVGSQGQSQVPSIHLLALRLPHPEKPRTAVEGQRLSSQGPGLGQGGQRGPGWDPSRLTSPGGRHGLRVLQIRHHHSRDGQHEATHHLFSVLRAPGVGKADEGTVDGNPSAPLQLEHEATHAEDHAKQVHVVWCWVIQGWVTLTGRGFVPTAPDHGHCCETRRH